MASHGAAIGLLIGLWLFSRKNKLPYVWSLDRIMIPVGIAAQSSAWATSSIPKSSGAPPRCRGASSLSARTSGSPNMLRPPCIPRRSMRRSAMWQPSPSSAGSITARIWPAATGRVVRNRPVGVFLTRFFLEFIKDRAGGLRNRLGARHGTMVEYPLHPAGCIHDLARLFEIAPRGGPENGKCVGGNPPCCGCCAEVVP